MHECFHWVREYGYAAIFLLLVTGIVGAPWPEETLLTFAGYLAFKGVLNLESTLVAGFFGSVCGITVSYLIGRTAGLIVIHKFGRFLFLNDTKLERVRRWFERLGKWVLVIGYFVPGVRHFTALVAGTSRLPYREFTLFAYTGALLWSTLFVSIGYIFGRQWRGIVDELQEHQVNAVIVAAVGLLAYGLFRYLRAYRRTHST